MVAGFQSFDESTLGAYTESPLGMRSGELTLNAVWATRRDDIYRLSAIDFTILDEAVSTLGNVWGIGGDNSVVWGGVDSGTDEFAQEYSPVDLTPVLANRTADLDGVPSFGCGGNVNAIYFCENNGMLYEFSPVDFTEVSSIDLSVGSFPYTDPDGVGGTGFRAYFVDSTTDFIEKRNPNLATWTTTRIAASPGTSNGCEGIGGGLNTCYVSNVLDDEIWVYDGILNFVSGPHPWTGAGSPWGIGGDDS